MPDEWKWNGEPHFPSADRDVIVDEEARRPVQAIRSLPKRQREMIALHYLDDVSIEYCHGGLHSWIYRFGNRPRRQPAHETMHGTLVIA